MSAPAREPHTPIPQTDGGGGESTLLDAIDAVRLAVSSGLDATRQGDMGQYFTPAPVAALMASLFPPRPAGTVHLLDAGAGIGSLSAAWVAAVCARAERPAKIVVTAYEKDEGLISALGGTMNLCAAVCAGAGIAFHAQVCQADFIGHAVEMLREGLFAPAPERYDCAILNPPYHKMHSASVERLLLRGVGIETSNLYTAFVSLALRLLTDGGDLVAITPRSFCNGRYFRPFRQDLLARAALRHVHLFARRDRAFADDAVLQETIIVHAVRGEPQPNEVTVTESAGRDHEDVTEHNVPFAQVVHPDDPERVIHLVADGAGQRIADRMRTCPTTLADLGLTVSTGRIVDFRARPWLRPTPGPGTAPLIYPEHCVGGAVAWPRAGSRKAQALDDTAETADLFVPAGAYVLVKRFSAKEERRRVVAVVCDPARVPGPRYGFENHINYYHCAGRGLPPVIARGLAAFLNSTAVDEHFRQWSGSTQVNATDLRTLRYPDADTLRALGEAVSDRVSGGAAGQRALDELVEGTVFAMAEDGGDPLAVKRLVEEAIGIIRALGFPRQQQNERSGLTLLALAGMRAGMAWSGATAPTLGITEIMAVMREHYGKAYAPNSRETVRRQTVHQFRDAGLAIINPDNPERPTNSGDTDYRLSPEALALLRTYGTPNWDAALAAYLSTHEALALRYARQREMALIALNLAEGVEVALSAGGQNPLIRDIVYAFCRRFVTDPDVLYIGDTGSKLGATGKRIGYYNRAGLAALGVALDDHGKFPDVIVHDRGRNWLLLIEAVTSHGPVDGKRHDELGTLFAASTAPPVYVTAFATRKAMTRYAHLIDWATEVWCADAPGHMIHFNGVRFLGPYPRGHEVGN